MLGLWGRGIGNRRRWLVRLTLPLAIGLAVLAWFAWQQSQARLSVENQSGQPIIDLQLTVSENTFKFSKVNMGSEVTVPQPVSKGDSFHMEGRLPDGTRISSRGNLGENFRFVVLPKGVISVRPSGKQWWR